MLCIGQCLISGYALKFDGVQNVNLVLTNMLKKMIDVDHFNRLCVRPKQHVVPEHGAPAVILKICD